MITPIETVADALIAFILSLLHDPNAVEEFNEDPDTAMAARGIQGACAADVRSVSPIVVDHPTVVPRPASHTTTNTPPDPTPHSTDTEVVREINRIINQFTTIDARATIVDQSTNQNIWMQGGDLTQIFDQEAVVAAGDGSMAAGHDVAIDDSETNIGVGDVAVGNTTGSHNTTQTGIDDDDTVDDEDALADDVADTDAADTDAAASVVADPALDDGLSQVVGAVDAAADAVTTATEPEPAAEEAAPAEEPAPVEEPAPFMADLNEAASSDSAEPLTPPEPDAYLEEPIEDQ